MWCWDMHLAMTVLMRNTMCMQQILQRWKGQKTALATRAMARSQCVSWQIIIRTMSRSNPPRCSIRRRVMMYFLPTVRKREHPLCSPAPFQKTM